MKACITTEIVSTDEFEEIGEFEMPLQKDYIMNVNIDREIDIINAYAERNGYRGISYNKGEKE